MKTQRPLFASAPQSMDTNFFADCVVLLVPRLERSGASHCCALQNLVVKHGGAAVVAAPPLLLGAASLGATHCCCGAESVARAAPSVRSLGLRLLSLDWVAACVSARARLPPDRYLLRPGALQRLPQETARSLQAAPPVLCCPPPRERNARLVQLLLDSAAALREAGDGHRAAGFECASSGIRFLHFTLDVQSLPRLACKPCLGPRDAPTAVLRAALGGQDELQGLASPPSPAPSPSLPPPPLPPLESEASPQSFLLLLPTSLLLRIARLLNRRDIPRLSKTCSTLYSLFLSHVPPVTPSPRLHTLLPLRIATWNIKNNDVNRLTGQPMGRGCTKARDPPPFALASLFILFL